MGLSKGLRFPVQRGRTRDRRAARLLSQEKASIEIITVFSPENGLGGKFLYWHPRKYGKKISRNFGGQRVKTRVQIRFPERAVATSRPGISGGELRKLTPETDFRFTRQNAG